MQRLAPTTLDDELEKLVDRIQGFGGYFVDEDGTPTANLVDLGQDALAREVLAPRVAEARLMRRPGGASLSSALRIRKAAFDFRELRGWSRVAEQLLDVEAGAVYVDVNERVNSVDIGVSDAVTATRVATALARRGVPPSAFHVEVTEPSRTSQGGTTILGRVRPLPGGVYITCTLGFNANLGGVLGFVTAAHCTTAFGDVVTPRIFAQGGDVTGQETVDPSPWQGTLDCAAYRLGTPDGICRYSDAAFSDYRFFTPDSVDFGYIARTTYYGTPIGQDGSFTIDQNNKHFEVIGKYYSIPTGVYVYRVAAASGWTLHNVSSACTTEYVSDLTWGNVVYHAKLWCQYRTGGGSRTGDSGGPIFASFWCTQYQALRADGTECVKVAGINWGEVDQVHRTLFSPISGVESDLGTLLVLPSERP